MDPSRIPPHHHQRGPINNSPSLPRKPNTDKNASELSQYRIKKNSNFQFTCFSEDDMKSLYGTNGSGNMTRRSLMKQKRLEKEQEKKKQQQQVELKRSTETSFYQDGHAQSGPSIIQQHYQLKRPVNIQQRKVHILPHHKFAVLPHPPQMGGPYKRGPPPPPVQHHSSIPPVPVIHSNVVPLPPPRQQGSFVHMRKRSYDHAMLQNYNEASPNMYHHQHSPTTHTMPDFRVPAHDPSVYGKSQWPPRSKSVATIDDRHVAHFRNFRPSKSRDGSTDTESNHSPATTLPPRLPATAGGGIPTRDNNERVPGQVPKSHTDVVNNVYDRRIRRRLSLTEECNPSSEENGYYPQQNNSTHQSPVSHTPPPLHSTPPGGAAAAPGVSTTTTTTGGRVAPQRRSSVSSLIGPQMHGISIEGNGGQTLTSAEVNETTTHDADGGHSLESHEDWLRKYKSRITSGRRASSENVSTPPVTVDKNLQNHLANFKFGSSSEEDSASGAADASASKIQNQDNHPKLPGFQELLSSANCER